MYFIPFKSTWLFHLCELHLFDQVVTIFLSTQHVNGLGSVFA